MKSNKLAACIKLAHKVTVYVPGTVGAASAGDTSEWIARAASLLSSRFGGATSSPAVGYWLSDVHGLIRENTRWPEGPEGGHRQHQKSRKNFPLSVPFRPPKRSKNRKTKGPRAGKETI